MSDDMWGEPGSLFGDPTDERPRRRASDGTDPGSRAVPGDDPLEDFDDPARHSALAGVPVGLVARWVPLIA